MSVFVRGKAGSMSDEGSRHADDWWQARREAVAPEVYGLTVARVASLLYGVDRETLRDYGVSRAQAMAYRDARGADITDADWWAIESRLTSSYGALRQAISARTR